MEATQISAITTVAAVNNENKTIDHGTPKKKRGAMNIIRVALFMLRHRSGGKAKSAQVEVASKGMWKRVVGSMRLLHLQDNQSQSPRHPIAAVPHLQISNEQFEDVFPPPMSPCGSSSSSCVDSNSRYASAVNLQELDRSDDCDGSEDYGGDMAIDAKAEEFIAHFYEQMRLQRVDSINRYNEMIARGMI